MLCTLHSTTNSLLPGLYIPNISHNRKHISSLLTEEKPFSGVLLSRVTTNFESSAFNKGYIQLLPIQLLEDNIEHCNEFDTTKPNPIVLFPGYLSCYYNVRDKEEVLLYKCELPRLTKVLLSTEESVEWGRDTILKLISSQSSVCPIPCQAHSTLLLAVPEGGEIAPVDQPARCLATRVECTEELPYGYIDPCTELELVMERVKKHGVIRFMPHGAVDSNAVMINQRDATLLGFEDGDWVEIDINRSVSNNVFDECDWLKAPPIDFVLNPIKRLCRIVILHERETICLQNSLIHNVRDDLERGAALCYVSSLILNTNSPLHPSWYSFYGDITRSKIPMVFASEVSIRQVSTPNLDTTDAFTGELKRYFTPPRLLKKGDFICVETFTEYEMYYIIESLKSEDGTENELLWATGDQSSLSQVGFIETYTPHCFKFENYFDCPFLYGMESYLVQLLRFVYPIVCLGHNPHAKLNNGILIEGKHGSGKSTLARSAARLFSMHYMFIDCHYIIEESPTEAEARLVSVFSSALRARPCVLFISSLHLFSESEEDPSILRLARYINELITEYKNKDGLPLIIIGGTTSQKGLLGDIHTAFRNVISMPILRVQQITDMLQLMTARLQLAPSVDLGSVAKECHKFLLGDVKFIFDTTHMNSVSRTLKLVSNLGITFLPCHNLTTIVISEDFTSALKHLRSLQGNVMGLPEIPKVRWEDIGGLEEVKEVVRSSLFFSSEAMDPAALAFKRCGLLLHGPPGCGKTMIAKAIATECKCHFISVKGPELLDMYVGQSENNLRSIFDSAIESAPAIIFFDEIDSLAPRIGDKGDSGGVMDRVASQLLTELDRIAQTPNVYVVAATNRHDLLDPAFLRPGRFDRSIRVGFSETAEDIEKVFRAVTKDFQMTPDIDLTKISESLRGTFSGSDIYSICYEAMMNSLRRKIAEYEREGKKDQYDTIVVSGEDFDLALRRFTDKKK